MDQVTLIRQDNDDTRSLGALVTKNDVYHTVERPWLDNQKNISCIPTGIYICKRYSSDKYPNTFEITNVPNRTKILFHVANWAHNVEGCIGLGTHKLPDKTGVGSSKRAISKFMKEMLLVNEFQIEIKEI